MAPVICTICHDDCGPAVCHRNGRPDTELIAAAYVARGHKAANEWDDATEWPWACANAISRSDPALCWEIILLVLPHLENVDMAGFFAADLLEEFVRNWSPSWIGEIETRARRDPRFRYLLTGVWLPADPDPVWERIAAIKKWAPGIDDGAPLPPAL